MRQGSGFNKAGAVLASRRGFWVGLALSLGLVFGPVALRADTDAPATPTAVTTPITTQMPLLGAMQWIGFLQNWSTLGEASGNGAHTYDLAGDYLKHFRVGFTSSPYPGVSFAMMSDLASESVSGTAVSGATYGITLLNAYLGIDLARFAGFGGLPLTMTVGQFKSQFGLNRMYNPNDLVLVDYSSIYLGGAGVFGINASQAAFWDDGLQVAWHRGGVLEAEAAWTNGQGPNLGAPSAALMGQPDQQFVGNLTARPCKFVMFGASYLYGELFSNPGTSGFPNKPKTFTDEYGRFALPGKSFAAELEFLNRSGSGDATLPAGITDGMDRNGLTATLSLYLCPPLQLVGGYDHVVVYGDDAADSTRYIGGLNWYPGGTLRFSLQQEAKASGISGRASSSWTILQSQIGF